MENNLEKVYENIKEKIINHQIYQKVKNYSKEIEKLSTYYDIGEIVYNTVIIYGNKTIEVLSNKLNDEFGNNYSYRNLMNYRKFYNLFKEKNLYALRSKLSWTHYRELIKLKDINEIIYYINISLSQNLSYRKLVEKIKSKEYDRLDDKTKNKLINNDNNKLEVTDFIKHPIVINNKHKIDINNISEKILKKLILEDIDNFLLELGNNFSYIKNEYKIKIGNSYNYIDLLLYNIKFNSYVVVELKVTELKKEHIGQIQIYMNYIDKNLKNINQDKTIGIIICKKDNKYVMEYCSDERILISNYLLKKV